MTKRALLVLAILCALALSSFALPTRSFLKQDGALTTENPELDDISDEIEFVEPGDVTNEDSEVEYFSDETEFMETGDVTSEDTEVENFSDETELMETSASGYHLCTQAGGKVIIENPKNTTGCTALTVCASANAVGAGNVRLWIGQNKTGKCYEFGAGIYTGTVNAKSVELGLDVEMVSFKGSNSATTLLESTNSVSLSLDSTMEVRVMNPDAVRFYFLPNFQGPYFDATQKIPKNNNTLVRSIRLGRNVDGIRVYSAANYGGKNFYFTDRQIPTLPTEINGNIQTIHLFKELNPNHVRLFTGPNYSGQVIDLSGRSNLSSFGWKNSVQSLKLGENVRFAILYDKPNQDDSGDNHLFTKKLVPMVHESIKQKAESVEVVLEC